MMSEPLVDRVRDAIRGQYGHLPSVTQDLMCSAYGAQELVRRRGSPRKVRRRLEVIDELHYDRARAEAVVERRLRHILDVARGLAAYRDRVPPRAEVATEELRSWPLLTKQELRGRTDAFLSRRPVGGDVKTLTSGTTGTPVLLWRPRSAFQELFTSAELVKRWFGLPGHPRRASFTGHTVVPQDSERVWRVNLPGNQLVLSQYHLRDDTVQAYATALRRWRPQLLDGYMSNVVDLAGRFEAAGIDIQIPLVVPSSEVLTPASRELFSRVFHARVSDKYGMSENLVYACECPSGSRHIFANIGIIEVLDEDDRAAPPGEVGRLVVTTLTNDLMPLVRYDIGDLGSVDPAKGCACGRTSPVLADVAGRVDDTIIAPDGRQIAIFAFNVIRGITDVVAVQVVQEALSHFVVRIVTADAADRAGIEGSIVAGFDRLLGDDPDRVVEFNYSEQLERTPGGKIRNVVRRDALGA
jgi:phenylacetate-CoA ligase